MGLFKGSLGKPRTSAQIRYFVFFQNAIAMLFKCLHQGWCRLGWVCSIKRNLNVSTTFYQTLIFKNNCFPCAWKRSILR